MVTLLEKPQLLYLKTSRAPGVKKLKINGITNTSIRVEDVCLYEIFPVLFTSKTTK